MAWQIKLKGPRPETADKFQKASNIPLFKKTPAPATDPPTGIKVLTTSRLGDMKIGPKGNAYPAQLLDGLRDILLNALWYAGEDEAAKKGAKVNKQVLDFEKLSDTWLVNLVMQPFALKVGTAPAAWASKTARLVAIRRATTSVHISSQTLVDYFMSNNPMWEKVVGEANKALGIEGSEHKWNPKEAHLWPFGEPSSLPIFYPNPPALLEFPA